VNLPRPSKRGISTQKAGASPSTSALARRAARLARHGPMMPPDELPEAIAGPRTTPSTSSAASPPTELQTQPPGAQLLRPWPRTSIASTWNDRDGGASAFS
jgi:hypothetical protein